MLHCASKHVRYGRLAAVGVVWKSCAATYTEVVEPASQDDERSMVHGLVREGKDSSHEERRQVSESRSPDGSTHSRARAFGLLNGVDGLDDGSRGTCLDGSGLRSGSRSRHGPGIEIN